MQVTCILLLLDVKSQLCERVEMKVTARGTMRYLVIFAYFVLTACSKSEEELVEKFRNFEVVNENYAHTEFLAGHNNTSPDKFRKMVLDEMQKNLPRKRVLTLFSGLKIANFTSRQKNWQKNPKG